MPPHSPRRREVTRTYLELRARSALRPAPVPTEAVTLHRRQPMRAAEYLSLYSLVGARWHWRDRLAWTAAELDAYLARAGVEVWTAHVDADTAGYFELRSHADGSVEIMYFGLTAAFIGRGLGGWLLTRAVERAFDAGASHVVLNTCTLDGPHALPNYLARGFAIVREECYEASL